MKLQTAIDEVEYYIDGMPEGAFQDAVARLLRLAVKCRGISDNFLLEAGEARDEYEEAVEEE